MVHVPDRRPVAVVVFVAVAVTASAMVVPVLSSHVAAARTDHVTTSVTDATVADGGDRVRLTLRLDNPTPRAVTVPDLSSESGLALFDGDERLTRPRGIDIGGARVPSGGSATVRLVLVVDEAFRPATREGIAGTELRGSLPIEVAGYETEIDAGGTVGAA